MESPEVARKVSNKRQMYSCYSELAHVLRESGELDEPLTLYRDLLAGWRDIGHRAAVAHELECIAYILSKKAEPHRVVMILSAADRLRKVIESSPTTMELAEYAQELSVIRAKLEETEFERVWQDGQKLNMDEAITLAVRDAFPR